MAALLINGSNVHHGSHKLGGAELPHICRHKLTVSSDENTIHLGS